MAVVTLPRIKYNCSTKNSQDALKKLRAELQEVDDQYRERLEPHQPDKEQLEQRRRAVVK